MMTRGGEGVSIPPKNDDVIYEQPLMDSIPRSVLPLAMFIDDILFGKYFFGQEESFLKVCSC